MSDIADVWDRHTGIANTMLIVIDPPAEPPAAGGAESEGQEDTAEAALLRDTLTLLREAADQLAQAATPDQDWRDFYYGRCYVCGNTFIEDDWMLQGQLWQEDGYELDTLEQAARDRNIRLAEIDGNGFCYDCAQDLHMESLDEEAAPNQDQDTATARQLELYVRTIVQNNIEHMGEAESLVRHGSEVTWSEVITHMEENDDVWRNTLRRHFLRMSTMSVSSSSDGEAEAAQPAEPAAEEPADAAAGGSTCDNCNRVVTTTGDYAFDDCWGYLPNGGVLCNNCGRNCDTCDTTTLLRDLAEDDIGQSFVCPQCR